MFDKLKNSGPFNEYIVAYIMKQILSSVYYIHHKKICHRDIKLDSFLIESIDYVDVEEADKKQTYEFPNLRLIDFNSARTFKKKNLTKKVGTVIN